MSDKCRKGFEKWARCRYLPFEFIEENENGNYSNAYIYGDWLVWQAAWNTRATPQAADEGIALATRQIKEVIESIQYSTHKDNCQNETRKAYLFKLSEAIAAIYNTNPEKE